MNRIIVEAVLAGKSQSQVAKQYGISQPRVSQLMARWRHGGESVPDHKNSLVLPADTSLGDQTNMAFSSTLVTAGRGIGITIGTGHDTQMGQIHGLVESAQGVQTPLTKQLARFSRWLTIAIIILALISFAIGLLRGESLADMVLAAVALAVSVIPAGLPAVVTITLAIGVSRMARRNAIVRKLPAVETLGSTTIICTDKTGTLTENQMTVQFIFVDGVSLPLESIIGSTENRARDCLIAGIQCNDASIGTGTMLDGTQRLHARGQSMGAVDLLGTFSQWNVIPDACIVKLEDHIPLDVVAITACGVPTGFGSAVYAANTRPGSGTSRTVRTSGPPYESN